MAKIVGTKPAGLDPAALGEFLKSQGIDASGLDPRKLAAWEARRSRGGDTFIAEEVAMLKAQGGAGTINPNTWALELRDDSFSAAGGGSNTSGNAGSGCSSGGGGRLRWQQQRRQ